MKKILVFAIIIGLIASLSGMVFSITIKKRLTGYRVTSTTLWPTSTTTAVISPSPRTHLEFTAPFKFKLFDSTGHENIPTTGPGYSFSPSGDFLISREAVYIRVFPSSGDSFPFEVGRTVRVSAEVEIISIDEATPSLAVAGVLEQTGLVLAFPIVSGDSTPRLDFLHDWERIEGRAINPFNRPGVFHLEGTVTIPRSGIAGASATFGTVEIIMQNYARNHCYTGRIISMSIEQID